MIKPIWQRLKRLSGIFVTCSDDSGSLLNDTSNCELISQKWYFFIIFGVNLNFISDGKRFDTLDVHDSIEWLIMQKTKK